MDLIKALVQGCLRNQGLGLNLICTLPTDTHCSAANAALTSNPLAWMFLMIQGMSVGKWLCGLGFNAEGLAFEDSQPQAKRIKARQTELVLESEFIDNNSL